MKQQRIIRLLALLCTLASLLSSVAFAAVTLPDLPPDSVTYVIVPADQKDYGISAAVNGIAEKKVPLRTVATISGAIVELRSYYTCVYTLSGEEDLSHAPGSYIGVNLSYEQNLFAQSAYIRTDNIAPKLQMRKVSNGQGQLNYFSVPTDTNTPSKAIGSLTTGTAVRYLEYLEKYTDSNGVVHNVACAKIQIYFPNATTGAKVQTVYIADTDALVRY